MQLIFVHLFLCSSSPFDFQRTITPCLYFSHFFFCISSNQFRLELFVYDIWPSIQSIGIGRIRLFFYWPFIVLNIKRYDLL